MIPSCGIVPLAGLREHRDFPRLLLEYHEEVGVPGLQPDPDWDALADLERRGELVCLAVYRDDAMAGFAVWRIFPLLGFRTIRLGFAEFLFLTADARKGGGAKRLLAASEDAMRQRGIGRCAIHDSADSPHDFRLLGYAPAMRVWVKDLGHVFRQQRQSDHDKPAALSAAG